MKILGKSVSSHFQSIYEDIVARIGVPKFYPNPPGQALGDCGFENGVVVIRLRTDMSRPNFEQNVAHELLHALQRAEGWPVLETRLPDQSVIFGIGVMLGSLVADFNVEDRLKQLSFDSTLVINAKYRNLKKALLEEDIPASGSDRWCRAAMMYAESSLTQPARRWNKLKELFLKRSPHIAEKGEELVSILKRYGWDNPDQALASMVAIRNNLGRASDQVTIVDGVTGARF